MLNNKQVDSRAGTNAVRLTVSQIATMMLALVNTMLLSRLRTLEEYGTYSQLLMISSLVLSFCMLGVPNSFNFFMARSESDSERSEFLNQYYTLVTGLGLLTGVILVVCLPAIEVYFNSSKIGVYSFFLIIYPWASAIISTIDYYLVYFGRVTLLLVFKLLNGLSMLSIALLVQCLKLQFIHYVVLFIVVEVLFAVAVYFIVCRTSGRLYIMFSINRIKAILKFSFPFGISAIIGTVNIELDKLLIGRFYNAEELAIYSNAAKEMPVTIIASSISTVLLPILAKYLKDKKFQNAINIWACAIIISYACVSFFAVALFVFAPAAITFLYSEKYLAGVSIFRIYSLLLLFRCTYFGIILNSMGKTKSIMSFSFLSLLMNVTLNILLYNCVGFNGPALATLISTAVLAISQLLYTSHCVSVRLRDVFPWRAVFGITIINIIFATIFYGVEHSRQLRDMCENIIVRAIILGIIWAVLYMAVLGKYVMKKWKLLNA